MKQWAKSVAIAGVGLFALAASTQAAPIGFSVRSDTGDLLYRIDLATGVATKVSTTILGLGDADGLAFMGNQLVAIAGSPPDEFWNITTPPGVKIGDTGPRNGDAAGLSEGPGGTIYNVNGNFGLNTTALYSINTTTGAATQIGATQNNVFVDSLAINAGGQAYAVDGVNSDSLYSVNLTTGLLTQIGGLGFAINEGIGLSFDSAGVLWMITSGLGAAPARTFTVNTATGVATQVATVTEAGFFINGFQGLAIADSSVVVDPNLIPEPAMLSLLALGIGFAVRRRRQR